MKKLSQEVKLTPEALYAIMTEEKPNQREQVKLPADKLRQYFPRGTTPEPDDKRHLQTAGRTAAPETTASGGIPLPPFHTIHTPAQKRMTS